MCEILSGPWEPTTIRFDTDNFRVVLPPVWEGSYDAANLDSATHWYYESMSEQEWLQFREDACLADHRLTLVGERQAVVLITNQRSEIGNIPEEIKTIGQLAGERPTRVAVFKQGKEVAQAYCVTLDHPATVIPEVQARLKIAGHDENTLITRRFGSLIIYGDFESVSFGTKTEDLMRAKVTRATLKFLCTNAAERKNAKTAKETRAYLKAENLIASNNEEWKPAQAFRNRFKKMYDEAIGKHNINGWRYWIK